MAGLRRHVRHSLPLRRTSAVAVAAAAVVVAAAAELGWGGVVAVGFPLSRAAAAGSWKDFDVEVRRREQEGCLQFPSFCPRKISSARP